MYSAVNCMQICTDALLKAVHICMFSTAKYSHIQADMHELNIHADTGYTCRYNCIIYVMDCDVSNAYVYECLAHTYTIHLFKSVMYVH